MILPITLTVAAALALLNVALAIPVVRMRIAGVASIGTGGNPELEARVRAHANLTEYAPFFLILLALVELAGASPTWVWVAGVAFVLARLSHAFGMSPRIPDAFRAGGAILTWVLMLLMAGWAVGIAYGTHRPGGTIVVDSVSVRA